MINKHKHRLEHVLVVQGYPLYQKKQHVGCSLATKNSYNGRTSHIQCHKYIHPYRGYQTGGRGLRISGALSPLVSSTFSLWQPGSRLLKKKSRDCARLLRVLPFDQGRRSSILGRPDAPGLDFGSRNAWSFKLFRCPRTFGANFVRSVQNTGRSYVFRISELLRN